jgi:hypothetical protein
MGRGGMRIDVLFLFVKTRAMRDGSRQHESNRGN